MPEFPTAGQLGLSKRSFLWGMFLQYSAVPLWMCNAKLFSPAFQSLLTPFPYLAAPSGTSKGLGFLLHQLPARLPHPGSLKGSITCSGTAARALRAEPTMISPDLLLAASLQNPLPSAR